MAVADKKTGKLTAVDYWNAAWRGLSPGGLNSSPPVATDVGPAPEPFGEDTDDSESYTAADPKVKIQQAVLPMPVILVEDLSHTEKRVEKFIITNTAGVSYIDPTLILPRNPYRTQAIVENLGPGDVWLGHNESVGNTGFMLKVNSVLVLGTTRELYCLQDIPNGVTPTAIALVSVVQEYDKDTVTT